MVVGKSARKGSQRPQRLAHIRPQGCHKQLGLSSVPWESSKLENGVPCGQMLRLGSGGGWAASIRGEAGGRSGGSAACGPRSQGLPQSPTADVWAEAGPDPRSRPPLLEGFSRPCTEPQVLLRALVPALQGEGHFSPSSRQSRGALPTSHWLLTPVGKVD